MERVPLEDPYRLTLHATVERAGEWGMILDRTIFAPAKSVYGHALPHDRGHVLVEGHKLKIRSARIEAKGGRVIHTFTGPPPMPGAKVILHLDRDRRVLNMRAHAALHLLEAAIIARRGTVEHAGEVKGNGTIRVDARIPGGPKVAAEIENAVNQAITAGCAIACAWETRDTLEGRIRGAPIALAVPRGGSPTVRCVAITGQGPAPESGKKAAKGGGTPRESEPLERGGSGGRGRSGVDEARSDDDVPLSRVPCESPIVRHTREIGRFRITSARPTSDGSVRILGVVDDR